MPGCRSTPKPIELEKPMYCDMCGAKIPDTAKFCRVCGARIEDDSSFRLETRSHSAAETRPSPAEAACMPDDARVRECTPMAPCPKCGSEMPADADFCQHCDSWLTSRARHGAGEAGDVASERLETRATSTKSEKSAEPVGFGRGLLWLWGILGFCVTLGWYLWHGFSDPKFMPDAFIALVVGGAGTMLLANHLGFRWVLSFLGWTALATVPVGLVGMFMVPDLSASTSLRPLTVTAAAVSLLVLLWVASTWEWYKRRNVWSKMVVGGIVWYLIAFVLVGSAGAIAAFVLVPVVRFMWEPR